MADAKVSALTAILGSAVDKAADYFYIVDDSATTAGSKKILVEEAFKVPSLTLVTPILGVATATSINKVALTAPATGSTLTIADGKTLTASNTLTLTATDGSTLAIGTGGTLGSAAYTASSAYQPVDTDLTAIAALTSAADKVPYATGAGTWALADFTAAGRSLAGAANAAAQITALGLGALATVTPGTGIATALAVNVGSAGAPVLFDGAGGTPSSLTLTNATGLPIGGIASLGTGVATALANAVNAAGGFLTHGNAATLGANTFTALQTITQASANAGILASTGYSLTGSNATSMIDLAGTWNTSGNPVALKIAMTNTASGSTSKFLSFLAGASGTTEKFSVDKDGNVQTISGRYIASAAGNSSTPDFGYQSTGMYFTSASHVFFTVSNSYQGRFSASTFAVPAGNTLGWESGVPGSALDTGISRNAAGVVEVNNGTAGTYRDLKLRNVVGQTGYTEMVEMTAPAAGAANTARIYCEDNGSGKTRLMVIFPSGAAQQIAIEP